MMRKRNHQNPIYDCPEFAQYRLKQKDKDCKVWPDVLEHAFLDGQCSPIVLLSTQTALSR